jgi:hypothetical protein
MKSGTLAQEFKTYGTHAEHSITHTAILKFTNVNTLLDRVPL